MIDEASRHPDFCNHPGLALYGIESYIAVPLKRRNGEVFGTLCALDPKPASDLDAKLEIFHLLADLISFQLEASELGEERERFLGVLGHDLRNPLQAIVFSGHALQGHSDLPGRLKRPVDRILRSARRIENMVGDLLDFARGRFGTGLTIETEEVGVEALVRGVVDELAASHPERQIELETGGEHRARWDEERVAQMLSNLVANALAHSPPESQVRVGVEVRDGEARLEVHNLGKPIPPDLIPRLFLPFSRAAETASGSRSGLGLGLYIASQIAEAHGGGLAAASSAKDGTRFVATLPLSSAG